MEKISSIEHLETSINESKLLIVMYGSQNCGPCQTIKAKLDDYLNDNRDVKGLYVPTEKFTKYCASHTIFMVPTVILYAEGKEVKKYIRNLSTFELFEEIQRLKDILE